MTTNELIPTLAIVTLVAVLAIAVGMFLHFLRRRRNRKAAARALTPD